MDIGKGRKKQQIENGKRDIENEGLHQGQDEGKESKARKEAKEEKQQIENGKQEMQKTRDCIKKVRMNVTKGRRWA